MGQLVLLVVAAAWAAVLIPPLLRSRIENRPNSSVSDFRNQLSSLQRAMPSRGVAMRSMARPLAPSPLSRPAATGRPPIRSGLRTHGGHPGRRAPPPRPARRPSLVRARSDGARLYDATPRPAATPTARPATSGARPGRRPRPRRGQAPPGQRAVRAGVRLLVLVVPRRHHQGAGVAVRVRHVVRGPRRLRLGARPAAPARAGPGTRAGPGGATVRPAGRAGSTGPPTRDPPEVAPGVDPPRSPGPSAVRRPLVSGRLICPAKPGPVLRSASEREGDGGLGAQAPGDDGEAGAGPASASEREGDGVWGRSPQG